MWLDCWAEAATSAAAMKLSDERREVYRWWWLPKAVGMAETSMWIMYASLFPKALVRTCNVNKTRKADSSGVGEDIATS